MMVVHKLSTSTEHKAGRIQYPFIISTVNGVHILNATYKSKLDL